MAKVKINFVEVKELKTLPGIGNAVANKIVQSRQTVGNFSLEDLNALSYLTVTQDLLDRIDWEVNPELVFDETQTDVLDINPDDQAEESTVNVERDHMITITDNVSNLIKARESSLNQIQSHPTEVITASNEHEAGNTFQQAVTPDGATGGDVNKLIRCQLNGYLHQS